MTRLCREWGGGEDGGGVEGGEQGHVGVARTAGEGPAVTVAGSEKGSGAGEGPPRNSREGEGTEGRATPRGSTLGAGTEPHHVCGMGKALLT